MMTKSAAAFEAIIDEIIRKAVEEMFKKALGGEDELSCGSGSCD